jgi:hypothetical protein
MPPPRFRRTALAELARRMRPTKNRKALLTLWIQAFQSLITALLNIVAIQVTSDLFIFSPLTKYSQKIFSPAAVNALGPIVTLLMMLFFPENEGTHHQNAVANSATERALAFPGVTDQSRKPDPITQKG